LRVALWTYGVYKREGVYAQSYLNLPKSFCCAVAREKRLLSKCPKKARKTETTQNRNDKDNGKVRGKASGWGLLFV